MRNHVSFDLDGTIIDSKQSIKLSMQASLRKLGIDDSHIVSVGPSLDDIISSLGRISLSKRREIKEKFVSVYDAKLCLKAKLYPDIRKTLQTLKDANNFLTLVTNKRTIPTMKILKTFEIDVFFSKIVCIDTDKKLETKTQILENLIFREAQNFYIGDLEEDYSAAKNAGYSFLHASWGYGNVSDVIKLRSARDIIKYVSAE